MNQNSFDQLRLELSVKAKNGINFIMAATICWGIIAFVWMNPGIPTQQALFTFFAVGPMMPLAWAFSKLLKTAWTVENNPLNPLGLWLNFAQLFYFPFIFIAFNRNPEQMPMALAIITGAHLFPYAWFYKTKAYAIMAGVISVGAAIIGCNSGNSGFYVAAFMVVGLVTLVGFLWISLKNNDRIYKQAVQTEYSEVE